MKDLEFTTSLTRFIEILTTAKSFGTQEQYQGACGAIRMIIGDDEFAKLEKIIEHKK